MVKVARAFPDAEIVATLSHQLSVRYGKDYTRTAIIRMVKVAREYPDEQNIKVAQYLTILPEKQWFIDKMNRSIAIARELQDRKETE